jgi:thiol-disulfide isomerase/thioredoxin
MVAMELQRWASPVVAAIVLAGLGLFALLRAAPRVTIPAGTRAPMIENETWLNSPRLTPKDLEGKVVVVEFWTFACINCIRTVPAVRRLHETYAPKGVVVIGVHSPELDEEKDLANVKQAVEKQGITWPVAIDDDFRTWRAFENRYWPAIYVVDRKGVVRYSHVGELHVDTGRWREVVSTIDRLLAE